MKAAACIFVFLIAAGASILYLLYVNEQQLAKATFEKKPPVFICGNAFGTTENSAIQIKAGSKLFKANCAACHKLDTHSTGPALRGVNQRYTAVDIIKFMRNDFSGAITHDGDQKCTSFPNLSDEDIKSILTYTY